MPVTGLRRDWGKSSDHDRNLLGIRVLRASPFVCTSLGCLHADAAGVNVLASHDADDDVRLGYGVSIPARLTIAEKDTSASDVFGLRYGLEVTRTHAAMIATQVVYHGSVVEVAASINECDTVWQERFTGEPEPSVAATTLGAAPSPAFSIRLRERIVGVLDAASLIDIGPETFSVVFVKPESGFGGDYHRHIDSS